MFVSYGYKQYIMKSTNSETVGVEPGWIIMEWLKKKKLCSKKLIYIEVVDIISTSHGCNNYVDNINSNPFELITIITFSIIVKYIMYI